MTYDPERDGPLRGGASNPEDEYHAGITPDHARRIADAIEAEARRNGGAPSTTPLKPYGASGVPAGYGKYGDLA